MDLTITYGELRITCQCEIYGDYIEVQDVTCPDYDLEIADFVADRYEKDQAFAMTVQDLIRREYHMVIGEEAAMREEMQQEDRMMAVGGGR